MEIKYIRKHNESFMTIIDEARAVEYESKMPLRIKDMVIFQKKRNVKVKQKA